MPGIVFDPLTHSYSIDGKPLESATTLINRLVPPFERERVSLMLAKKRGVTQDEILKQWDASRELACTKGEMVHAYIEDVVNDGGMFRQTSMPECRAFSEFWNALETKAKAELIETERIAYCRTLGIAGRIDMLLSVLEPGDTERTTITIDWKTGRYKTSNPFEKMLAPFNDLDSCEHVKASMQASLYRIMLESEGIPIGDSHIVHLGGDCTYSVLRAMDLRDRLIAWIKGGCRA